MKKNVLIVGVSGAGKSTLVRCINHIEVPTEGTVIVQDKDLSKLSEKELRKQREHIGMIFQHFNLLMQKSVLENVCFPLFIQGKSKAEAKKKEAPRKKKEEKKKKKKEGPSWFEKTFNKLSNEIFSDDDMK